MNRNQQFSGTTKRYLCRFYEILDKMIQGMTGAELTNSISHNFIVQMIPITGQLLKCLKIYCCIRILFLCSVLHKISWKNKPKVLRTWKEF